MTTPEPYKDSYLDDVKPPKGFFDQFRHGNFPTLYDSYLTSVTADVLLAGWIFAACILGLSLYLIVPGFRRWHGRLSAAIRISFAVGFWVIIMLCNFGQDWEVADVKGVHTQYKALLPGEIKADIGVHIGLRSVNITLTGNPRVQSFENGRMNETIDYNERFSWDNNGWTVGRAGFGPYAGRFNQEFRAAQRRGLPYPILWIAEYFTVDGEGLRWGRHYLQAGYFTHIFIWTAWALWMVAVIMFATVPRYGGYFSLLTGICLLVGNIIYGTLRNANPLLIPFVFEGCGNKSNPGDNRQCIVSFEYSWCFWLCLATGISCVVIAVAVILLDLLFPERLSEFFNVDIVEDIEEIVISEEDDEKQNNRKKEARHKTIIASQNSKPPTIEMSNHDVNTEQPTGSTQSIYRHGFRKRAAPGFGGIQKTHKTRESANVTSQHYSVAFHVTDPTVSEFQTPPASSDYVNLKA